MNARVIVWCCRILLALVFLLACLHKILFPESFALAIYQYQILPDAWINLFAITLPWVELVAAISILFPPTYKHAAALLMVTMLAVFALAMSITILRGLDVSCGCFSASAGTDQIGWSNVIRNLGYMLLAMLVVAEEQLYSRLQHGTQH